MLKIAFCESDITPSHETYLDGYTTRKELSKGKYDELECNCMLLSVCSDYLLYISLDMLAVSQSFVIEIKQAIKNKFGINTNNVIVSAIHTHSAPAVFRIIIKEGVYEDNYKKFLAQTILQNVETCFTKLTEVNAYYSTGTINGFFGNRNIFKGMADKNVQIVDFRTHDNILKGCIINLACHPTILGADNLFYSADLIGMIRRQLAKEWNLTPLIINGACGDISTRFYRQGQGYEEVTRVGKGIASQILQFNNRAYFNINNIHIANIEVPVDYYPKDDWNLLNAIKRLEGKLPTVNDKATEDFINTMLNELYRRYNKEHIKIRLFSSIFTLGEMRIITIPGELTTALGLKLKEESPKKVNIISCYSNDYLSYLVDKNNYGLYFESFVSDIPYGKADELIETIISKF